MIEIAGAKAATVPPARTTVTQKDAQKPILKSKRKVIIIFSALLIGLLFSAAIAPLLFNQVDSEFIRTRHILRLLDQKDFKADAIFFGSSLCMNGINARLINQLEQNHSAYNLSSSGQRLGESFLYYQNVPATVKDVVQCVSVEDLMDNVPFPTEIYNFFYLYNYRPQETTVRTMKGIFPEVSPVFEQYDFAIRFDGRKTIASFPNILMRKLLRKDLALDRASKDMYYPSPFTQNVSESQLEVLLSRFSRKKPLTAFKPSPQKLQLLAAAQAYFAQKGVRYHLLLMPVHPRIKGYTPAFHQSLAEFSADLNTKGYRIHNCSQMLQAGDFVDHSHPNQQGAEKLSRFVADQVL